MDFEGVKEYIIKKFEKELPAKMYYHNLEHTLDVLKHVEIYGEKENVTNEDMLLLKTAALFHDIGFIFSYDNHEAASVQCACSVLSGYGYTQNDIEKISSMILSTEIASKPKTKLEMILCDADVDYLGRDDFYLISIRLLCEWNEHGMNTTLKEWYIKEINFMEQHEYYTDTAKRLRDEKQKQHLAEIRELFNKNE